MPKTTTGACKHPNTTQWYNMGIPTPLFCQEKILEFEIGNITADGQGKTGEKNSKNREGPPSDNGDWSILENFFGIGAGPVPVPTGREE